jgi:anti-anti-sigma regulatory factor
VCRVPGWQSEMLKIETLSVGDQAILKVIGRLQSENLPELAAQIAALGAQAILDMDEVTLVDVEVVRFLVKVESSGSQLRNCPPYIREWMTRERGRTTGT